MMAKRSPAIPTFIVSTTLSTADAATAASIALPPCIMMRNPACAASGWLVVMMPCCAITSARLWSFQPSERSPRTAVQAGAFGSVLQTESGGNGCAAAKVGKRAAERSPRESVKLRVNIGRPPAWRLGRLNAVSIAALYHLPSRCPPKAEGIAKPLQDGTDECTCAENAVGDQPRK